MKLVDYINHLHTLVGPASYSIAVCKRLKRKDIYSKSSDHPFFRDDDVVHRNYFLEIEGDYDSIIDIVKNIDKEVALEIMQWGMSDKDAESITRYDDINGMKNIPTNVEVSATVDKLALGFYIVEDSEVSPDVEYHDDANYYSAYDIYRLFSTLTYPASGIKFIMFDTTSSIFKPNNTLDTEKFHEVCAQVKFSSIGYMKYMNESFSDYCVDGVIPSIIAYSTDYKEDDYMIVYLIKK